MRPSRFSSALALLVIYCSFGRAQEPPAPPKPVFHSLAKDITLNYDQRFPIAFEAIREILQTKEFAAAVIGELTGARPELSKTNDEGALLGIIGFGPSAVSGWATEKSNKAYFSVVSERHRIVRGEGTGSLPLRLTVGGRGAVADAELEKYAQLVVKRLNQVLADVSRRAMEHELAGLKSDAEQAQQAAEFARQSLDDTQKRIRQASGDLAESSLQEIVTDLTKQRQALEVELAGMKGRIEALQEQVARNAKRAEEASADDEIVKNLTRVIELRAQQQRYLKELADASAISKAELAKAEEQVALAKIELAQAKRTTSRSASEQLDKLNGQLTQATIGMSEAKSKLDYVSNQLELRMHLLQEAAEAKPFRVQLEKQIAALADLRAQADEAAAQVRKLESSFRPARVEFFELKTGEEKPANSERSEK